VDATAYDRSLVVLRALRRFLSDPRSAAEVVGEALTAGRPRSHYRVGADARLVEVLDLLAPRRVKDRLAREVLGA
jgi:hypothetical protein